jgi:hypothetical protein
MPNKARGRQVVLTPACLLLSLLFALPVCMSAQLLVVSGIRTLPKTLVFLSDVALPRQ